MKRRQWLLARNGHERSRQLGRITGLQTILRLPKLELLRAALVLSGAGALRDKGARLAHGEQGVGDDGLLSAEEVLGMNLEGTQLVTLSACQSASGETQAGAGLYGLPRAFAISSLPSMRSMPTIG